MDMDIDKKNEGWLKDFDFDKGLDYDSDASDFQPGNGCVALEEVQLKENMDEGNYVIIDDSSDDNQETSFPGVKKEDVSFKEERDENEDTNFQFDDNNSSEFNIVKDENLSSPEEEHQKNQDNDSNFIKWSEFKDAEFLSMRFDSLEEAFTFYNEYAKYIGFSVRKDILRRIRGVPMSRKFVCSKQGMKDKKHLDRADHKRSPRSLVRCNCPAFIRLNFEFESHKWVVKSFVAKHNHELAPFPDSLFFRSHRNVSNSDGALAQGLHGVGVKKSQVMDYIIHKAGGFEKVGYIRKDFYNYMDKGKKEVFKGGDSATLLEHMDSKSKLDPLFRYKSEFDEDKRLIRLFWADKRSCADYKRFGDVLLFDSTYRTNVYKMALVLFAGVNNHHQTVIFGCALMTSESDKAYTWALSTLVEIMGGRTPKSVITDGDQAIRKSIKNVLPSSSHRLCSWHIMQNCLKNINIPGFAKDFCDLMYHQWSQEQFEDGWKKLVIAYNVGQRKWIQMVYKKRTRWAEAYLRGLFFAGCRSNQRCESLNAMIRHHVKPNLKISELYQKIGWAIEKIRHRTHEEEVRTLTTFPSIDSHLPRYEKYAASMYTRSSYQVFKSQLQTEALYSVVHTDLHDPNSKTFTLSRHRKRVPQYFVEYNMALDTIKCTCTLFESYGFPCGHIISALKHGDVEHLPTNCILKRWARFAQESISVMGSATVDVKIQSAIRYNELMEECKQFCLVGCRSDKDFEHVKSSLARITNSVMHPSTHCEEKNKTPVPSPSKRGEYIHEPPLVASKGRPNSKRPKGSIEVKRQKRCSYCSIKGHTRPTCPSLHFEAKREDVGTSNERYAKAKVIDNEVVLSSGDSHDSGEVIFKSAARNNDDFTCKFQPVHDGYCDPVLGPRFRFA